MKKSTNETRKQGELYNFTSKVERKDPIEVVSRGGWVKWGEDNLQPQMYNTLAYDNAVHGGIVNQKVNFITAGGLVVEGADASILDNFNSAFNLQEVIEANTHDFEVCNQFYILFKKNFNGNWIASYMENSLIRVDEDNVYYHYSEDWSTEQQNADKTAYRIIKSIHKVDMDNDTECLMQVQERPKQRLVKTKQGKTKITAGYYPVPTYSGGITSIKSGIKMTFFVYSEVSNGYKGGTWINLANGIPATPEEEKAIVEKVKGEASDEDLWGGLVITFSEGKEREPRISQINGNDLDKRYSTSKKDVLSEIMIAHGVISQALFGVMSENIFGSKEELETAYNLFKQSYVRKRQRTITEALTWAENKLNGFIGEIKFNEYLLTLDTAVQDDTSKTSLAINSLSPLVATKVLNSMTPNEIRALASLIPREGGDEIPAPTASPNAFKSEDHVISLFENCGVSREDFEIKHSQSYDGVTDEDFKAMYLNSKFAVELTEEQNKILGLIKDGQPYQAINEAIGKGAVYLSKQLITLGRLGVITDDNGLKVTDKAPPIEDELQVMYAYELRSNAPELVKGGTSRPFCKRLVELNRLYTIQEIDQIGKAIDRDVWSYRGGWYHNPESGKNTPSCRHEWRQVIV